MNENKQRNYDLQERLIEKMKVALKELRETLVWLLVIQRKPLVEPFDKLIPLIEENNELISIFVASIATAQENLKRQ